MATGTAALRASGEGAAGEKPTLRSPTLDPPETTVHTTMVTKRRNIESDPDSA
jgi:hypothetical protein